MLLRSEDDEEMSRSVMRMIMFLKKMDENEIFSFEDTFIG